MGSRRGTGWHACAFADGDSRDGMPVPSPMGSRWDRGEGHMPGMACLCLRRWDRGEGTCRDGMPVPSPMGSRRGAHARDGMPVPSPMGSRRGHMPGWHACAFADGIEARGTCQGWHACAFADGIDERSDAGDGMPVPSPMGSRPPPSAIPGLRGIRASCASAGRRPKRKPYPFGHSSCRNTRRGCGLTWPPFPCA